MFKKQIGTYFLWTLVSFILAAIYIWTLLGPITIPKKGLSYLLYLFFQWGVIYVGLPVGFCVAVVFIITDIFYLKKKLISYPYPILARFGFLIIIMMLVFLFHYILEKIINVI